MIRPGLPRQPLKLMFLTAGASAVITFALILVALVFGIEHRGVGGHRWLEAAMWLNVPGALVVVIDCVPAILATGGMNEIPDLTFVILSACISTVIYGFAGLWLGITFQRRRTALRPVPGRTAQPGGARLTAR